MTTKEEKEAIGVAIGCVIGGLLAFFSAFRLHSKRRLIASTPTSKVRSVALGIAELSGRGEQGEQILVAPFSQKQCVFYSCHVEEKIKSGKNSYWKTVADIKSSDPFYLNDGTGRILVVPLEAELKVQIDNKFSNSIFSGLGGTNFNEGMQNIGLGTVSTLRTMRCKETYIAPGDQVFVIGTVQEIAGKARSKEGEDNLFIGKSPKNWFLISDKSEKELIREMFWLNYVMLFGGPILVIGGVSYILKQFNYI